MARGRSQKKVNFLIYPVYPVAAKGEDGVFYISASLNKTGDVLMFRLNPANGRNLNKNAERVKIWPVAGPS